MERSFGIIVGLSTKVCLNQQAQRLKHPSHNIDICYKSVLAGYRNDLFISDQCSISYRNQSYVLQSKTNDWFIYEMQH